MLVCEELYTVMNNCTVLISVSYFEFSRKRGIHLKLERLSYKSGIASNDTCVRFVDG